MLLLSKLLEAQSIAVQEMQSMPSKASTWWYVSRCELQQVHLCFAFFEERFHWIDSHPSLWLSLIDSANHMLFDELLQLLRKKAQEQRRVYVLPMLRPTKGSSRKGIIKRKEKIATWSQIRCSARNVIGKQTTWTRAISQAWDDSKIYIKEK